MSTFIPGSKSHPEEAPNDAYSASKHAIQGAGENVQEAKDSVNKATSSIKDLVSGKGNMVDTALAVKGAYDNVTGLTGRLSATAMMPVMKALSAFKGQAILPAGKQMDPVLGIDVHMVTIPPSPAPVPMPHPYIGILFNTKDWVSCLINTFKTAALSAIPEPAEGATGVGASLAKNKDAIASIAMGLAGMSASVKFGGFVPRAVTGTKVKNIPHIPMGAGFHPAFAASVAKNDGKAFLGSLFVAADGDPMVGSFHLNYDCWDIGIVDLFKGARAGAKKAPEAGEPLAELFVPSGTVLPIPWGRPVLVNSIPTPINPMAILDHLFKAGLGKLKAAGRKLAQKGLDKLNGKVGCAALTAASKLVGTGQSHPVDVSSGHFYTDNIDFSLPGPIPFSFERTWYSYSSYQGPLGHGWHHSYDMALAIDNETQKAILRMSDGRVAHFDCPTVEKEVYNRAEKLTLYLHTEGYYYVSDKQSLLYRFTQQLVKNPFNDTETFLLQSVANRNAFAIRFAYNKNGVLSQITDSAGRLLIVNSDQQGCITSIDAPDPRFQGRTTFPVASYSYTGERDMASQSDALDQPINYEYQNHLMRKEIWRSGLTWYIQYDKMSGIDAKCIEIGGDENLLHYKFNFSDPDRTIVINSLDYKKTFVHKNGVVIKYIDPLNNIWEYRYNQFNELAWEVDPLGNITSYSFDDWGNITSKTESDGAFSQTEYTNPKFHWVPERATDNRGGKWKYQYNDFGDLTKTTNPIGSETKYIFEDGLLHFFQDDFGYQTELLYDSYHNLKELRKPNGAVTLYEYDYLGNCTAVINPNGQKLKRQFDLKGRIVQINDFDGNVLNFVYDALDNIILFKDLHKTVSYTYKGMWNLTSRTEEGVTVRFVYDTENQLSRFINQQSLSYLFERDGNGEIIKEVTFDGIVRNYLRNAAGFITKINRPDSKYTAFEYDSVGRIIQVTYDDGNTKKYSYVKGFLNKAVNSDAIVTFEHDILGNIVKETCGGNEITFEYDKLSRRRGLKSSLGANISVMHDNMDKISGIDANGWNMVLEYDKLGLEISRSLTGGVNSQLERDSLGRIKEHTVRQEKALSYGLFRRRYKWENMDQLRRIEDNKSGVTEFEHDAWGNLAKTKFYDGVTQLRNPDSIGNLFESVEKKDRIYEKGTRLVKSKNAVFKYNSEGFLIEKRESSGDTWKYHWNSAGCLIKVIRPDNTEVSFKYDALGRRIEKKYKKTITKWLWDRDKTLHEWKEFDAKESTADELITWVFEDNQFSPAAKIKGNNKYSIIKNHLGTPIRGYNEAGTLIWNRELDSYGNVKMLTGDEGFCNYIYPGQILDVETGLAYNRFRYYSAKEGIYISQDPIGLNSGQPNFYAYVKDPNIWIDEFGLDDGGSYRDVRDSNDGGQVHHMPANSVNRDTGMAGRDTGPAIHMTTDDHAKTASHGSQGNDGAKYRAEQAALINNGRYDLAMAKDIRDVSKKFPGKYTDAMKQAIQYALDRNPPLITEEQARNLRRQCK